MLDYAFNDMKMPLYDKKKISLLFVKSISLALILGYFKYRNQVKKNN